MNPLKKLVLLLHAIPVLFLSSCSSDCGDGSLDALNYPRPPSPDNYCQLNIGFKYTNEIEYIYYPQVNQQLGLTEYYHLVGHYEATLLNGFDTTIVITKCAAGEFDTTLIHADRYSSYNECNGWQLKHKNVYIISTTIDSLTFSYSENFANLNILKP